ncbi:alpha/beta fold hydrolase [Dyella subtropica]|uniref:alpha/beta fold hydrolase n=1 Tax=Dyella subtropica TaxID=2992127 RepID=UPI0022560EDB|nr:alpha/beta hydrolase [Dyella subtropica]
MNVTRRFVAWSCMALAAFFAAMPVVEAGSAASSAAIHDGDFVTSDGAHIHYLYAGARDTEPALVLIPGWTLTASLWRGQLDTFSPSRRVIAVDSRSQGGSALMLTGNTPERRAQDLHELLAQLQVKRFVIVGWSQGAQDVAAYILQFGTADLAGVAFVDSPVSAGPAELDLHKEFSRQIITGLGEYAAHPAEYTERVMRSIFKREHPELDMGAVIASAQRTPSSIGTAMLVADIFGTDRRPALQKIDRPALVVASAESPLLDVQKEMAASIRGAQMIAVPGAGHAVFVDDPTTFNRALRELLRRSH